MDGIMDQMMSEKSPRRSKAAQRVVAFTLDTALGDSLTQLANGTAIPWIEIHGAGFDTALQVDPADFDVVLTDVSDVAEREAAAGIRDLTARGVRVIAIGRENDVGLYRTLTGAGARDYLVIPLDEAALTEALSSQPEAPATAPVDHTEATTRTNLIVGARGGVGASSLAIDAAWWAAETLGVQTGLIDFDLHFGSCALALDLMPGRGLRDALESPERIDGLFVGSAMMNVTDNLFVLAAEESVEDEVFVAPDASTQVLSALSESFPCVVADVPRSLMATCPSLVAKADSITLVSELSLIGLRDALRLKKLCASLAPQASVALALIDSPVGKGAIDRREFTKGYGAAPDWIIPYQPKVAAEAASAGKPMVSLLRKRHPLTRAVADIAERCVDPAGIAEPKKKRKWLM